ncbi:MAG: hypothetical protein GQ540_03325 [Lutibacter sp.]|uniref:hypothetical protein n=1 Tax=Lutibacter sp. TaxID=1925666 RepID=UPI0019F491F6|nr:hypothetical protein [Lutibacter sp.]NOR27543.1 hypothetical protein [Lutibacter sp.]
MSLQCCCGRYKDIDEEFISNGFVHQPLGVEGNFCGPVDKHTIKYLKAKITELEKELLTPDYHNKYLLLAKVHKKKSKELRVLKAKVVEVVNVVKLLKNI